MCWGGGGQGAPLHAFSCEEGMERVNNSKHVSIERVNTSICAASLKGVGRGDKSVHTVNGKGE